MTVVGDSVPEVDIRVVQGDTFTLSLRRLDANGEIIDTDGYDARMMIRTKASPYTLICELDTVGGVGLGTITTGIQGVSPEEGEDDLRSNVNITIPADVTAGFPRVLKASKAEWEYDLEMIADPLDAENTTDKWIRGDCFQTNEVTYDE
jgi:hypothetical protein